MPINGWDIDVATVNAVIHQASAATEDLRAEESTLQQAVSSAAASTSSSVILQALTECYEEYLSGLLGSATGRAENACESTGKAVSHYIAGDEEMAHNAAFQAGQAPTKAADAERVGGPQ